MFPSPAQLISATRHYFHPNTIQGKPLSQPRHNLQSNIKPKCHVGWKCYLHSKILILALFSIPSPSPMATVCVNETLQLCARCWPQWRHCRQRGSVIMLPAVYIVIHQLVIVPCPLGACRAANEPSAKFSQSRLKAPNSTFKFKTLC